MSKGGANGPLAGRGGERERHVGAGEWRIGEERCGGEERGGLAGRRAGGRVGRVARAGRPGAQMRGRAGTWAGERAGAGKIFPLFLKDPKP